MLKWYNMKNMTTRLVIEIDEDTKKKLQILCIQEGVTIKEKITKLILKAIAEQ